MAQPSQHHIVYILANIDKAIAFEWINEQLNRNRFRLSFILMGAKPGHLYDYLRERGVPVYYLPLTSRRQLPLLTMRLLRLLRRLKPHVVHTHLLEANLAGLTAAWLAGVPRRIHTRHHSTYHHDYAPHGVRYDQWSNRLSTQIVAISDNVAQVLRERERVPARKIIKIPHGFDLQGFQHVPAERRAALQRKYGLAQGPGPVVGVVARYISWKGWDDLLPAFRRLLAEQPQAHLLIAGASGPQAEQIRRQLSALPGGCYTEIRFEPDLFALYHLMDIFVHVPIDPSVEAFGQIYVEALAAARPAVVTLSGIAPEFIQHERNALVVPHRDPEAIYNALVRLWHDAELRERLGRQGQADVAEEYALGRFIHRLETLYGS
jgi:glycosyltransferase involved in cell wall biosynthesis